MHLLTFYMTYHEFVSYKRTRCNSLNVLKLIFQFHTISSASLNSRVFHLTRKRLDYYLTSKVISFTLLVSPALQSNILRYKFANNQPYFKNILNRLTFLLLHRSVKDTCVKLTSAVYYDATRSSIIRY